MMEQLIRYRIPIFTALGALVLVLVAYMAWISPEGAKVSSLKAQESQLQSQQDHLRAELVTLRKEKAHQAANCQELTTDLTEIPGTPTVDGFFQQVTALAVSSGDPNTPSISVTNSPGSTVATATSTSKATNKATSQTTDQVAVNLTLTGTYSQMTSFIRGLTTFPRLFTVEHITVDGGPLAGQNLNGGTAGYTLQLGGSIYYSTGQSDVCTADATATAAH